VVKFWNIEGGVLQAVQSEQDDAEDKDLSDVDSDSEDEGGDGNGDEMAPPPRTITFEIDRDIDITSQALRDMVLTEYSVCQPPLHSLPLPAMGFLRPTRHQVCDQIGIGRLWRCSGPIVADFH
jgi:hypothetical protein